MLIHVVAERLHFATQLKQMMSGMHSIKEQSVAIYLTYTNIPFISLKTFGSNLGLLSSINQTNGLGIINLPILL